MIKVKKHWRQVESDIIKACNNLPYNIKLCKNDFGIDIDNNTIIVHNYNKRVCPLGAYLLGKKSNEVDNWQTILGVPYYWYKGFYNGVDNNTNMIEVFSNDFRAGWQAGRRVAKRVGLS
jgi:hypothetical protein